MTASRFRQQAFAKADFFAIIRVYSGRFCG
nr:MAG TPA: hypothetical protein [Caudoviricetes sp.]